MTRQKQNPSELDIYNSAWESLKSELNNGLYASLKSKGWKLATEILPDKAITNRTRLDRLQALVESGHLEKIRESIVVPPSHARKLTNLYRPIISGLTSE